MSHAAIARGFRALSCLSLLLLWTVPVLGEPMPGVDDDLEAARWADRVGEAEVLERLASTQSALSRLRAIRAAPALRQREKVLALLAPILGGRDPDLAPAAGRAAVKVAQGLRMDDLQAREVSSAVLPPLYEQYEALASTAKLRPDLVLMAEQVLTYLNALRSLTGEPQSSSAP